MFYLYFPYVILLTLVLLAQFAGEEKSKMWAVIVLFAPVTAPYYIFRVKKEEGITWIMIFLASFSAVIAGEIALYAFTKEKLKYVNKTPIVREAMKIADELKTTTAKFDASIITLEEMSRIISGLGKIEETINFIAVVRENGNKNKVMVAQLKTYVHKYRSYYSKKNINWVLQIDEYYNNAIVSTHLESLDEYLNSFEDLLVFSYKNFYKIVELEDLKFLKNYDAYYLRYRRAAERFSKYNSHRTEYQRQFVQENPKIAAYLPGARQTKVFSIHTQSSRFFF